MQQTVSMLYGGMFANPFLQSTMQNLVFILIVCFWSQSVGL